MHPFEGVTGDLAVALAEPGEVYVVFLPLGGKVSLDLMEQDGPFSARWYNTRDGSWGETFDVNGGAMADLAAPSRHDWALLLRRK
jgi:hypothetical protein